jgi:ABC-type glutathione transport system ATPase component
MTAVLQVERVGKRYRGAGRPALVDASFAVASRRTLAIVGESGAGKSTLARIVTGLERPDHGSVLVDGTPQVLRPGTVSRVQSVFQNPFDALLGLQSIGESIGEPLRRVMGRQQRRRRVEQALTDVGLDPRRARERPRAFSGGQLQRVVLARALVVEPKVLVCDEPTSALDVSVQAQVLNLLMRMQEEHGFACVLVTHDLGVARVLAHDVLVLRRGEVVEQRPAPDFFASPHHPYARSLLDAERVPAIAASVDG